MFVSFFFNLYGSDGLLVVRGAPSSQLQFSLCVCSVPQSCPTVCHPLDCARQAPLFMGFPRQEYWSGLPFPSPGDLPEPTSLVSPALPDTFFTTSLTWEGYISILYLSILLYMDIWVVSTSN